MSSSSLPVCRRGINRRSNHLTFCRRSHPEDGFCSRSYPHGGFGSRSHHQRGFGSLARWPQSPAARGSPVFWSRHPRQMQQGGCIGAIGLSMHGALFRPRGSLRVVFIFGATLRVVSVVEVTLRVVLVGLVVLTRKRVAFCAVPSLFE